MSEQPTPNQHEDDSSTIHKRTTGRNRLIILLLIAYSFIAGVLVCFLPEEESAVDYLVGLPLLVLGIWWCVADAAERNHRIGLPMRMLLVLLFVVGLPVHLFQTRGIRAFRSLGLLVLLLVVMFVFYAIGIFATLFMGDLLGLWPLDVDS